MKTHTKSRMEVPRISATEPAVLAQALDAAGCCVVEGFVSEATTEAVREELQPFTLAAAMGSSDFEGRKTRRTGAIIRRSATYRSFARHPLILASGEHVLGNFSSWGLSSTELIEILPGQPSQPIHRDQWKFDFADLPWEVEVNCMVALTDFTEENGATRVIPGSHRYANDLRPDVSETVAAEMSVGSALFYLGSTYHGGGANVSNNERVGLSLIHVAGWFQPAEMLLLDCPPDVVAEWDDEALARFIGYRRGGDSVGIYLDSLDPLAAVFPDREYPVGWATSDDFS